MSPLVKPINDTNLIDVFCGNGWTHWSRFAVERQQGRVHLKLIKGAPMAPEDFKTLYQSVSR